MLRLIPRSAPTPQENLRRRLPFVIGGLIVASLYLLWKALSFQYLSPSVVGYLDTIRDANYGSQRTVAAERGRIFDRHGQPLAVNTLQYEIGVSPNLISAPRRTAQQLAAILELDELDLYNQITRDDVAWVQLARGVSAAQGQEIAQLDILGVIINPIPRRTYPQGALASHLLGFVGGDSVGFYGVEGYYEDDLAGRVQAFDVSNIPLGVPVDIEPPDRGTDLVLTIDREVQYWAEAELMRAVNETGAQGGTILIMNPRNGDVLAMANYPSFDPNNYLTAAEGVWSNRAISSQYEPGSVMKVLTVATALDRGAITPGWTYLDQARIEVGGRTIENWDDIGHGEINVTQVLVQSLNVGVATIVTQELGMESFYGGLREFGIGQLTGVDLQGEASGTLRTPDNPLWSESDLATNSFGQGVAVTPIQMLTAVNAIANDGLMYQPRVVYQVIDSNGIATAQPIVIGSPISASTANIVTDMMVQTVNSDLEQRAAIPGYSIAGKSGTAEISDTAGLGYLNDAWNMSYVGFFPADDPQVSVLIWLERPTSGRWASQVAAPVFRRIAERLVILMEIPPDNVRVALAQQGAEVGAINR
jgi:cell division protein FtsI (penicillin-binding protein 3)